MDLAKLLSEPWAILPSTLQAALDLFERADGKTTATPDINARAAKKITGRGQSRTDEGVAEIPIYGAIAKNVDIFDRIFGGATATGDVRDQVQAALADDSVHTILLDIDSPGGTVAGVPELADVISAAAGQKNVVAFTDGMMASAAYWLGASANKVYASRAAQVGSIGVFATLTDLSVGAHQLGMKREVVKHGRIKGGGTAGMPLDADTRQQVQASVDTYGEMFDAHVMASRGLAEDGMAQAGEGRLFIGAKAQSVGLIDEVATYEDVRARLITDGGKRGMKQINGKQVATERAEVADELLAAIGTEGIEAFAGELAKLRPTTVEALEKDYPALVAQVREKIAPTADAGEAVKAAVAAERQRCADIVAAAFPGQEAAITSNIMRGTAATEAADLLAADRRRRTIGASPASVTAIENDGATPNADTPEGWKAEWEKSAELKSQFSSADVFVDWKKGERAGAFR